MSLSLEVGLDLATELQREDCDDPVNPVCKLCGSDQVTLTPPPGGTAHRNPSNTTSPTAMPSASVAARNSPSSGYPSDRLATEPVFSLTRQGA